MGTGCDGCAEDGNREREQLGGERTVIAPVSFWIYSPIINLVHLCVYQIYVGFQMVKSMMVILVDWGLTLLNTSKLGHINARKMVEAITCLAWVALPGSLKFQLA